MVALLSGASRLIELRYAGMCGVLESVLSDVDVER